MLDVKNGGKQEAINFMKSQVYFVSLQVSANKYQHLDAFGRHT